VNELSDAWNRWTLNASLIGRRLLHERDRRDRTRPHEEYL
jgi:hypothetical protein